jgi:hypothetical protein
MSPKPESIPFGNLTYEVVIARTAQVFYFVDQISQWSQYSHPQYARWAEERHMLGARERELLATHKQLRAKTHGWGALDHAFASALDIGDATARATREHVLDAADAKQERAVLEAFAPLLTPMLDEGQSWLEAFRTEMKERGATFGRVLADVQAFAGTYTPMPHPLYLVVNPFPHAGGGGDSGGIAWVEIGEGSSSMQTLVHETIHAIFEHRWRDIAGAASACGSGLDGETLNEALDYAISPGMVHDENEVDPLASGVRAARRAGKPASDPYVRFQRLGLALRPRMEEALSRKETLTAFLPRVCDAWTGVLSEAWP